MELKICERCKKPYLADAEKCPHCPEDYEWNQDSWANACCLIIAVIFALLLVVLPVLMLAGMFVRF